MEEKGEGQERKRNKTNGANLLFPFFGPFFHTAKGGGKKVCARGGGGEGASSPFPRPPPFRAGRSGGLKSSLHNPKKDRSMMKTDFQHFPAPHQQWWYLCPVNFGYIP